jgi:hypothetical protein
MPLKLYLRNNSNQKRLLQSFVGALKNGKPVLKRGYHVIYQRFLQLNIKPFGIFTKNHRHLVV